MKPSLQQPLKALMKILVVDDDFQSLSSTGRILEHAGHEVLTLQSGVDALLKIPSFAPDLIVTDVRMPGMDGKSFVSSYQKRGLEIPFIVMTAFGEIQDAVEFMKMGAVDFLLKPFKKQDLLSSVSQVLSRSRNPSAPNASMIGSSSLMEKLKDQIHQIATSDASVLVLGESGSGKEMVSRLIHQSSGRKNSPFIAVNCAAIPESLIESELFGYEKGAFSDAQQSKLGLIEAADGGTLMLDEIGDMPLHLQPKLLRVIETQCLRRLGSIQEKQLNVRFIAATHQKLQEKVKQGLFRQDLYYRLEVMPLWVPPLRDRVEDIPELTLYFLSLFSQQYGKKIMGIHSDAQAILMNHAWPGNIRELSNVMERAVVLNTSGTIHKDDLPPHLISRADERDEVQDHSTLVSIPLGISLKEMEDILIQKTLAMTKGDRSQAAKLLGVNERTIYRKISRSREG